MKVPITTGLCFLLLAGAAWAIGPVLQWTNTQPTWTQPTTIAPGLTVTDLKEGVSSTISSDGRGTLNNGWQTGRTYWFDLTVPSGHSLIVTDWAVSEWQQWSGILPTFTLDVTGDASVTLGSVTATSTSNSGYATFPLAVTLIPSVRLDAGTYRFSLLGQDAATNDGGWMGAVEYTINGSQVIPEPASLSLLALGGLALLRRRRK